jgi:hypothetical protein
MCSIIVLSRSLLYSRDRVVLSCRTHVMRARRVVARWTDATGARSPPPNVDRLHTQVHVLSQKRFHSELLIVQWWQARSTLHSPHHMLQLYMLEHIRCSSLRSRPLIWRKTPNTPEQFQEKYEWIDDAKFYVHVKLRCYKSPCKRIKKVKLALK